MSKYFSLSAYETTAQAFFQTLEAQHADLVLDVRLKNSNQLCGFTKQQDLDFFIPKLTGAHYVHDLRFAPSPELLDDYLQHRIDWAEYARRYAALLQDRAALAAFHREYDSYASIGLLGTATRKRQSHSEALLNLLQEKTAK